MPLSNLIAEMTFDSVLCKMHNDTLHFDGDDEEIPELIQLTMELLW